MKNWAIVVFTIFVITSSIIHIFQNNATSYEEIIKSFDYVIKIFSPVGVFLLGCLGLLQWKNEFTFKKRYKIAEEIALSLLDLKNAMHGIRTGWPISTSGDISLVKGEPKDEDFFNIPTSGLTFSFNEKTHEDLSSRVDLADSKKEELEQKLKIAAILWNSPDIEKAGKELFSFYNNIINAIYRIRFAQSFKKWSFKGDDIEKSSDLSFVFHFNFRTKNKTADELNSVYKEKLDSCSGIILEKISEYLY